MIRTNVSAVPLTLFQFRLLHLKARKEVQSWFILRLYTAQITWNVIPHVIDSYVPGDHWVFITRAVCTPTIGYKVQNIN